MPSLIEDAIALKEGRLKAEDIREGRRKVVEQIASNLDDRYKAELQHDRYKKRHNTIRGEFIQKVKAS
jgi:hypothetical protein